jgi:hypothetical protein
VEELFMLKKLIGSVVDAVSAKARENSRTNMETNIEKAKAAEAEGDQKLATVYYNLAARQAKTAGLKKTARELMTGREELSATEMLKAGHEADKRLMEKRKGQIKKEL